MNYIKHLRLKVTLGCYSRAMLLKCECAYKSPGDPVTMYSLIGQAGVGTWDSAFLSRFLGMQGCCCWATFWVAKREDSHPASVFCLFHISYLWKKMQQKYLSLKILAQDKDSQLEISNQNHNARARALSRDIHGIEPLLGFSILFHSFLFPYELTWR